MAVWQFDFFVVSKDAVVAAFDGIPERILSFVPADAEADSDVEEPTYLSFHPNTESVADLLGTIVPELRSWSDEARMFGTPDGDKVELWSDLFLCRVDLKNPNIDFIERVLYVVTSLECLVVCKESGKVLPPNVGDVCSAILDSSAATFVQNPVDIFNSLASKGNEDVPAEAARRERRDRSD